MRRARAAIAVVLAAMSLTGCAAATPGIVGLQRSGGHVHAYVRMCGGESVDTLRMIELGGTFHDTWTFDAPVTGTGTYDLGVYDDSVVLIDTGNTFSLEASSSTSDVEPRGLTFTSGDLATLKAGKILVRDGSSLVQLDEDGFETLAAASCG